MSLTAAVGALVEVVLGPAGVNVTRSLWAAAMAGDADACDAIGMVEDPKDLRGILARRGDKLRRPGAGQRQDRQGLRPRAARVPLAQSIG
jgi:hypothetical protein